MNIQTTVNLVKCTETVHVPPLKIRSVEVQRHEHGFKLLLSESDGLSKGGNAVELILDAESVKTLLSAIVHPSVAGAVRCACEDQQKLMRDIEKLVR